MPFTWNVYRERPQRCYSLAAHLLGRIDLGEEFGPGSLLPSYGALAKAYGVSLSTVRRAVALLENLGAVATVHGVGTRVARAPLDPACLRDEAVQKQLALFREGLPLIRLTFPGMAAWFFPRRPQNVAHAAARLRARPDAGFLAFFRALGFVLYENENAALREI